MNRDTLKRIIAIVLLGSLLNQQGALILCIIM